MFSLVVTSCTDVILNFSRVVSNWVACFLLGYLPATCYFLDNRLLNFKSFHDPKLSTTSWNVVKAQGQKIAEVVRLQFSRLLKYLPKSDGLLCQLSISLHEWMVMKQPCFIMMLCTPSTYDLLECTKSGDWLLDHDSWYRQFFSVIWFFYAAQIFRPSFWQILITIFFLQKEGAVIHSQGAD